MEQLERRDFALSNDPNARATYVKIKRERAKKQMKAIALKNMKGVGESAAEQALTRTLTLTVTVTVTVTLTVTLTLTLTLIL